MKIILTHDVSGLGTPGDIVEVKDGYGRNFLLPQGFAIPWSKGAERQIVSIKRARSAREIRDLDHAKEVQDQLEGIKVILSARAGGNGRLFGSVTTADIAAAVKAAGGPALDKRKLETSSAIKSVGGYQVRVRLHPDVTASIQLSVVPAKA